MYRVDIKYENKKSKLDKKIEKVRSELADLQQELSKLEEAEMKRVRSCLNYVTMAELEIGRQQLGEANQEIQDTQLMHTALFGTPFLR